jgi:hypothetical protein
MKRLVAVSLFLIAGALATQAPAGAADKEKTPDALQAEIAALKPAQHVWRAIAWKTCPLEALKEARDQKKPVLAWVFLGTPTDERC